MSHYQYPSFNNIASVSPICKLGMKDIWKRDTYCDRDFAKDGEITDLLEIIHDLKS
ncbi:hypothetical protein [Paenibacillus lautus]|uniref:hypothetical protein n=1 Tax=Paenibacillus lautus TaxID=1401 RepID=UPI003D2C772E